MRIKIKVRKKYEPRYTRDGAQIIDNDFPLQKLTITRKNKQIHVDLPDVVPSETAMVLQSHIAGHLYDNDVKSRGKRIIVDMFHGQRAEDAINRVERCVKNSLRYFPIQIERS